MISIVIPTYKGAATIGLLVEKLIRMLGEKNLEITIVNDRSPDDTHPICLKLYERFPDVINYIQLSKNVGEHAAVLAGIRYSKGDYLVIVDDDFQNPPEEVIKLIEYSQKHSYDVVYTYYGKKHHSFFRNFGSRINDLAANYLLEKPKGLYLSSFKCITRKLAESLVKYEGPFPYIDGLIMATTRNLGTLKVKHAHRGEGESGYTIKKLFNLWLNMATNFSILPLRVSMFLGVILNVIGGLYAVNIFVQKINNPAVPIGWASLYMGILFFSGTILLILGVLGEYVGKILLNVNRLPQFHVDSHYLRKGAGPDLGKTID